MKHNELQHYGELLADVKLRIRQAQTRAVLTVNAELVHLYWDIGCLIAKRQHQEGWGPASSTGWRKTCTTNCRK